MRQAAFWKIKTILFQATFIECQKECSKNVLSYLSYCVVYESSNEDKQIRKNLDATNTLDSQSISHCQEIDNESRTLYITIRTRQTMFFCHMTRREALGNIERYCCY